MVPTLCNLFIWLRVTRAVVVTTNDINSSKLEFIRLSRGYSLKWFRFTANQFILTENKRVFVLLTERHITDRVILRLHLNNYSITNEVMLRTKLNPNISRGWVFIIRFTVWLFELWIKFKFWHDKLCQLLFQSIGGLKCFFSLVYKSFEEKSDTYTPRCAIVKWLEKITFFPIRLFLSVL